VGIVLRNLFTLSTTLEFQFANATLMREFIKVSAVESLQGSENTPNTFDNVKADRMAILQFLYRLWDAGSTGTTPKGELFGKSFRPDGSETKPEDHFEVKADIVNNPVSQLQTGNRNLDSWFTAPTPAGSIKIGVGLFLRD
jgi:hypothetical protein